MFNAGQAQAWQEVHRDLFFFLTATATSGQQSQIVFIQLSTQARAKRPLHQFYPQGRFVDEKLSTLLSDIKAHPEWKEPEKLEALRAAGPKFGPENKKALLKSVPAGFIYQFSGCRLNFRTATSGAGYGWVIQSTYRQLSPLGVEKVTEIGGRKTPTGAVVVTNGWDHEHWEVCCTHVDRGDYAYRNERDL